MSIKKNKFFMYAKQSTTTLVVVCSVIVFSVIGSLLYRCIRALLVKQSIEDASTLILNLNYARGIAVLITCSIVFMILTVYNHVSIRLTEHDMLTGLYNYDRTLKYGTHLSVLNKLTNYAAIIINIKGFKNINQQQGYLEGNRILIQLATQLKTQKNIDFISRLGADTFFLLVKKENLNDVLKYVTEMNPVTYAKSNDLFPAPVRCGVYNIKENDTIEYVISICTVTINHSYKYANKDYAQYDDTIYNNVIRQDNIIAHYRDALQNNEFHVYYQPKVNAQTGKLCGAEALVRWYREDKFVSPLRFIPVLEDAGLIVDLDFYMLRKVCTHIQKWLLMGLEPVRISVNFSKLHLENDTLAKDILAVIDEFCLDHKYITIEMTESSGYFSIDSLNNFIHDMNESGILVAMDDFGTGFSSLSLLGETQMQEIKLDKSFVDGLIGVSETQTKFISNVIKTIKDLNRTVVCEGIETVGQLALVKKAGCDVIQGYYYDKPLQLEEFEDRLKNKEYK